MRSIWLLIKKHPFKVILFLALGGVLVFVIGGKVQEKAQELASKLDIGGTKAA